MISIQDIDDVCVLKVNASRLDSAVGTVIRNAVATRCEDQRKFVLDLSEVKLVDSGGLGSMVAILKNAARQEARFVLSGMQRSVRLMFELSRMDRQFTLYEDVDQAVQGLSQN